MSIKKPKMKLINRYSRELVEKLHDRSMHLSLLSPLIKHFYKLIGEVHHFAVDFNEVERNHSKAYHFACSKYLFGFKDKKALMNMIHPITRIDKQIQDDRRYRQRETDDLVRKDVIGSDQTAYQRYKKIASAKWKINFGHTHEHSQVYRRLIENVSPSQFEFECGAFHNKIIYMTGLWSVVKEHDIKKVDNKVTVYAKLISEDEHGLKVFKAKWIRPINKHPKYVNESGYIFSHNGNNITAAKNVKAEQRIETVAQKMMTEKYGETAMTRINDLAGKPVPYYLYPTIIDYIFKETQSGSSTLDVISHFRFTVFMTSVMNQIKVTKEASEAEVAAAEAEVAAEIEVEVDKAVKESIEAAGLTDLIDKINASKDKAA